MLKPMMNTLAPQPALPLHTVGTASSGTTGSAISSSSSSSIQPTIIEEKIIKKGKHGTPDQISVRKYIKGKLLGKGGFAKCFEFKLINNGKTYAAKVIDKESLQKEKTKQKLQTEIKIHRSLQHNYIVKFYSNFEDKQNVYILLELCRCRSLMELLRKKKRLSEVEARYFLHQILSAVQYMHENRVIHRDLKLGNLFINENMEIKIGDFGLAAQLLYDGERKKTMCGTPNYIAPEILDTSKGHSYEVDVWSIGVILYTLLIGTPPFETAQIESTYTKIKRCEYSFPPSCNISENAKELIRSILNNDPMQRPNVTEIMHHSFFTESPVPYNCCPKSLLEYAAYCKGTTSQENVPPQSSAPAATAVLQAKKIETPPLQLDRIPLKPLQNLVPTQTAPRSKTPITTSASARKSSAPSVTPSYPYSNTLFQKTGSTALATDRPSTASSAQKVQVAPQDPKTSVRKSAPAPTSKRSITPISTQVESTKREAPKPETSRTHRAPVVHVQSDDDDDDENNLTMMHNNITQVCGDPKEAPKATAQAAPPAPIPTIITTGPKEAFTAPVSSRTVQSYGTTSTASTQKTSAPVSAKPSSEEEQLPAPSVWVKLHTDFSNKYGLAYMLNNGFIGAHFNDSTKMIWNPFNDQVEYMERKRTDIGTCDERNSYTILVYPADLNKKITLIKYFKTNFEKVLAEKGMQYPEPTPQTESKMSEAVDYVKRWLKTSFATIFRLSNKTVQVCFTDNTEIILSSEARLVTYTNQQGVRRTFSLNYIVNKSQPDVAKRLKYTKDILYQLISRPKKEAAE